jgi:UDP-N-acetylmuramate--alanine ligase
MTAATSIDEPDLSIPGRFHLVGIGGSGMSAIAEILAGMGHHVSGSDLKESANLERLRALGIEIQVGHRATNVGGVDAIAVSTAIGPDNPEVRAATEQGVPVLRRAQILTAITGTRRTIAVGGTHGKTTTSSMLALALRAGGWAPSFIIGGDVNEVGSGAVLDEGEWMVVEADESDGTFLELHAEAAILTSAEPDHLEHYGGVDALMAAFDRFVVERPGPVVVCADDEYAAAIARRHGRPTYGTASDADYRITDLEPTWPGVRFRVLHGGTDLVEVRLSVPGHHNVRNATGALALVHQLGGDVEAARGALERYAGVARRFQHRGEAGGVTFVDDYAHLPSEVAAALEAAREGEWGRVICVFQPHRYSRTASLWRDFADSFEGADVLGITDVYSAGEAPRPGVSGRLVLDAVLDAHPWHHVAYVPRRPDQVAWLRTVLRPGDLCLTLGAGDLTSLPDEVREVLREKKP